MAILLLWETPDFNMQTKEPRPGCCSQLGCSIPTIWEHPSQGGSPQDLHPRPLIPPNTSLWAFSSLEGAAGKV